MATEKHRCGKRQPGDFRCLIGQLSDTLRDGGLQLQEEKVERV